jgi:hypothetical protein
MSRSRTQYVTVQVDLDEFATEDLVAELREREDFNDNPGFWAPSIADHWTDVESALLRKDFDWLERWLWPQVKAQYPKLKFVKSAA